MNTVAEKLKQLSDQDLLRLSKELQSTTIPADALIRQLIKGTDMDTTAPLLAFVGVGQLLAHELAERFEKALGEIESFHSHDNPSY